MLAAETLPVVIALLTAASVGGIILCLFPTRVFGKAQALRRLEAVAAPGAAVDRRPQFDEGKRRRIVEATLREIEDKQKVKEGARPTLTGRMRQAGMTWSRQTYYVACMIVGLTALVTLLGGFDVSLVPALGFAIAGGLLLPHLYIDVQRKLRFKQFAEEFPNAVDVIVRGVKAGLPLVDCLKIISAEAQEPVRSEFKLIVEDQTMGMPMDQAVQRLPDRIPLPETTFFAIVIALQSRTGGSLSETLANLSKVLRERKKMQAKIRAVSAEAKSSAMIIGSLPIVVGLLLYLTSPDYIALLFTTFLGKLVLAASAFWMAIGILVMRKMINFEI
ncbi:type II secretion system F family protein [Microvirga sp. BSC39]|uniref:type II secretion system F family protein n=1 Tax=Microvirga sp. BSC39 TaxID=1549810 RepID=UPI0004E8FDDA|nr:type II secretion system F family protein [Microvirga sp. BSC39]KFG70787.1 pilus assembly protein [Microvirga sp. BSC39]